MKNLLKLIMYAAFAVMLMVPSQHRVNAMSCPPNHPEAAHSNICANTSPTPINSMHNFNGSPVPCTFLYIYMPTVHICALCHNGWYVFSGNHEHAQFEHLTFCGWSNGVNCKV